MVLFEGVLFAYWNWRHARKETPPRGRGISCNELAFLLYSHPPPHTLQHTATRCSTLQWQHTVTNCKHCNTLQRTATRLRFLMYVHPTHYTTQHTATHCNTLQHNAAHYAHIYQCTFHGEVAAYMHRSSDTTTNKTEKTNFVHSLSCVLMELCKNKGFNPDEMRKWLNLYLKSRGARKGLLEWV